MLFRSDGGHIAMLAIEGVLRRDLPLSVKERINQVGFVLLILLMVTVLGLDVAKLSIFQKTP